MKIRVVLIVFVFMWIGQIFAQQTIFFDSFEDGTFNTNYWEVKPGSVNGLIDIQQGDAPDGFFRVRMGKSSDAGGTNVDTLCLHLDLTGQTEVFLEFWIADIYDENGPFDEIRLSDDGGNTSVRATLLSPESWRDLSWGKYPPIDIATIARNNGLDLNDQFVIIFKQQGIYDVNTSNGQMDGFLLDAFHVYDPDYQYITPPQTFGFEDSGFNNSLTWVNPSFPSPGTSSPLFINPQGFAGRLENQAPPVGNWVMGLGNRFDGPSTVNAFDIHLDLSNEDNLDLNFWIKDFYDENHPEDGIFLSDDGGKSFSERVYPFFPNSWVDNFWGKLPPIDLDNLIREHHLEFSDSFIVRFQQRGNNDFNTSNGLMDGLLFDQIQIGNPNTIYVNTYPFVDGFESGQLEEMWHWGDAFYPDTTAFDGIRAPGGWITTTQAKHRNGFWSVLMGRRSRGASTTNALDLHLNLLGAVGVILDFWVADWVDESGPSDGIWISVDGGNSFTKIFQLNPSNWNDQQFTNITVNISDSVIAHNLTLSDSTIIRFQQNGTGDFNNNGYNDGFWIDDVTVSVDSLVAITFSDNLEPGQFELSQNYPNPFNPTTTIEYTLPKAEKVYLTVFNMLGQEVATLVNGEAMQAGVHSATFYAENLPSGVYYYRINAGSFSETKKMLLVR